MIGFFGVLLGSIAVVHATDGFSTGEDLSAWCEAMDEDDTQWGLCVGSITVATDMVQTYQAAADVKLAVCLPRGATRRDVVDAVQHYMADHPDELDFALGDVVFAALTMEFPCP